MDAGEIASLVTIIGGILTALGAGNLVPLIGPAVQGVLAVVTLGAAIWSMYSHRQKSATIAAAGISK